MISHIGKNSQRRNELVDAVTRIIARQSSTDAVLRLPTNDTRPGHVAALQTLVAESYAKQTVICVSDRCRRYMPVIGSRPTNAVLATAARANTKCQSDNVLAAVGYSPASFHFSSQSASPLFCLLKNCTNCAV